MISLKTLVVLIAVVDLGSALKCFVGKQEECADLFIKERHLEKECEGSNMACVKATIYKQGKKEVRRDCIPYISKEETCQGAKTAGAIAQAFGAGDIRVDEVKCEICTKDLCNSGVVSIGSIALVASLLAVKLFL